MRWLPEGVTKPSSERSHQTGRPTWWVHGSSKIWPQVTAQNRSTTTSMTVIASWEADRARAAHLIPKKHDGAVLNHIIVRRHNSRFGFYKQAELGASAPSLIVAALQLLAQHIAHQASLTIFPRRSGALGVPSMLTASE
jgi:hypothetical protein